MDGKELATVEEEKDIVVIVHKSLKPSKQCKKAADTAGAVLRTIHRNFHFRDRNIFMRLYKQYVRPHLEFSSQAWSPWLEGDKAELERVQERAVQSVSGLKSRNYQDRCKELGIATLEKRREIQDLVHAYKIMNDMDRTGDGLFELVGKHERRTTRFNADSMNIVEHRARTDIRKNFFTNRVARKWNELDRKVKMAPSVGAFKRAVNPKREGGRPF